MKPIGNTNVFVFMLILLIALFIGCQSGGGNNSGECDCSSYSGGLAYIEVGGKKCVYCETCVDDNTQVCECPSKEVCEGGNDGKTLATIGGIFGGFLCIFVCLTMWCHRRDVRRRRELSKHNRSTGRVQPTVHQPTPTTTKDKSNSKAPLKLPNKPHVNTGVKHCVHRDEMIQMIKVKTGNNTKNARVIGRITGHDSDTNSSIIKINVDTDGNDPRVKGQLVIDAMYDRQQKMQQIFNKILNHLHQKYYPTEYELNWIKDTSFTGEVSLYIYQNKSLVRSDRDFVNLGNKSITEYDINEIQKKGLSVYVTIKENIQKVDTVSITCPEMNEMKTSNPQKCTIYFQVKEKRKYSAQNIYHLYEFTHFVDEYNEKPVCENYDSCKAYKRLENGGNEIDDQCHMKIYRHPPRNRNVKLMDNVHAFIINKSRKENHPTYDPTDTDMVRYNWNETDGFLRALIEEVIANGYTNDLGVDYQCTDEEIPILKIVDEKMNHIRHKAIAKPLRRSQMLALILYTGCECNYDLCTAQRNGDYRKWKWFDYCLWNAIYKLSAKESGSFEVWSGLQNVKMPQKSVKRGFFTTYVSSTWKKDVATVFVNQKGMILKIDKEFKNYYGVNCCDVSWISKFPDECEILFARTVRWADFTCTVVDEIDGIQIVLLHMSNSHK